MMKTTILLRIAAVLAFIQYAGHSFLFFTASPNHGQDEIDLVESMKALHWNFSGFMDSYWDFYFGYGLIAILWGVVQVFLLWQLSNLAKESPARVTPTIVLLFVANIGHTMIAMRYFFLVPVIFDSAIATLLFLSLFVARRSSAVN